MANCLYENRNQVTPIYFNNFSTKIESQTYCLATQLQQTDMPFFHDLCKNLKANINRQSLVELLTGVVGIYFSYIISGIINERIIKRPYVANGHFNSNSDGSISQTQMGSNETVSEYFSSPLGFVFSATFIPWVLSEIIIRFKIPKEDRKAIPRKNAAACAFVAAISSYCYNNSIYLLSFPVAALFKSCNVLSVIIVGVCCSRVSDARQKLKADKIVVGVVVTIGLLIFKLSDPEGHFLSKSTAQDSKSNSLLGFLPINLNELLGFGCLLTSSVADGFLPDFQAEIKQKIKPDPYEMLAAINKWMSLIILTVLIATNQIPYLLRFCGAHPDLLMHLIVMGLLSTLGQVFVYRMIKRFKQHIVPFVITTRKIVTASISLVVYGHQTSIGQALGIAIVFGVVIFEFGKAVSVGSSPSGESSIVDNAEKIKQTLRDQGQNVSLRENQNGGQDSPRKSPLQEIK